MLLIWAPRVKFLWNLTLLVSPLLFGRLEFYDWHLLLVSMVLHIFIFVSYEICTYLV